MIRIISHGGYGVGSRLVDDVGNKERKRTRQDGVKTGEDTGQFRHLVDVIFAGEEVELYVFHYFFEKDGNQWVRNRQASCGAAGI